MQNGRGLIKSTLAGLFLMLFAIAGSTHPKALHAATTETITMISGNGVVGQRDAANKFTVDGGATWQDAYIISTYPAYSLIPGTKYLNKNPNYTGSTNTSVLYRTYFYLPSLFTSPTLTVKVFADNVATVFLNGVQFGQQPWAEIASNFSGTPSIFTATNQSLFHAGLNYLEFSIYNYSSITAFDYQASASFTGCDSPQSSLVSWWPADGNTNDNVSYNTGTLISGVTYTQGKAGQGFKFDGIGRVVVPDADNLDITGPITIDAWVNFTSIKNYSTGSSGSPIVAKWGSTSNGTAGYGLFIDSGGYVYFKVSSTGSDTVSVKSINPLAPGLFMHTAGVWNGIQAQLYVNGELVASAPFSGPIHSNAVPFLIGGSDPAYSSGSDSLIGMIDEVELYNRALSGDEVAIVFYAGGTDKCEVLPPPQVFTNVRLLETIPTQNLDLLISSATKTPYSVMNNGDSSVVEWRFGNFAIGQDQSISVDMNLSNLIPGEYRALEQSSQLIYNDSNNQEITVNLTPLTVSVLNSAFTSTISTDKAAYQVNQDAVLSTSITNLSGYARTIDVKLSIEDAQGNLAQSVTTLSGLVFAAGETKNLGSLIFNTGTYYEGNYRAHLVLLEKQSPVGETFSYFTILPTIALSVTDTVDKLIYDVNENVTITSTVTSMSPNYAFENLTALVSVSAPSGTVLSSEAKSIVDLLPGATLNFKSYWNTGTNLPGTYPVTVTVKDSTGAIIATGTQNLVINSMVKPKAVLKGQISLDTQSLFSGATVTVFYSVTNIGNIDLANVGLSVLTVHVANQTTYDTLTSQATLSMGSTYTSGGQINTQTYSAKDYLVVLRANIAGVEETLAGTYFRVEGAPSASSLVNPGMNADVDTFTPTLSINNASDPNDDKLTYEFEVYSDSGLTQLVASGSGVQGQESGLTSWTIPVTLTENQIYYWRSRAYDGKLYGDWMAMAIFRVNTVNDPPSAPVPTSPAHNGSVDTLLPVLTITNAIDPDSANLTYNCDVALDPDFISIATSTIGVAGGTAATSWQVPLNLIENSTYYWRCQADDWLDLGPWSTTSTFFVNTANDAPTVPLIISPLNNAVVTALSTDITVTNSIDPDSAVISYVFELDKVLTFDSSERVQSGVIPQAQDMTSRHVDGLRENTLYYVRAKASDGSAESDWSAAIAFFVNAVNDAPGAPSLANPSNGAGVNSYNPTLSVNSAIDPDRDALTYEFEVFADSGLAQLVVAGSGGQGQGAGLTSWTAPVSLTENQTYYWRSRAFDGALYSDWTPTWSFMVNTANDAPGAPTLSSPVEGGSVATLSPTLAITNAVDPDSDSLTYDFEVYAGGTLIISQSGVRSQETGVTSWTVPAGLSDNTIYEWRCRAFDGDRYGPWMNSASFTVHVPQTSINATIDFDPNTLNKSSNGTWVVVYIEFPAGYTPADVDVSTVRLEGSITAEVRPTAVGDHDKDGIPDLMVKFKRSEVISLLPGGERVPVKVTGRVGGIMFEGLDIIRVMQ